MLRGGTLSNENSAAATGQGGNVSFADKFNLLNEFNILRIACGAFLIPHIYAKFFVPEALGFFVAAKFKPPKFWLYVSCVIEIVLAAGLILGVYTSVVAWVAAFHGPRSTAPYDPVSRNARALCVTPAFPRDGMRARSATDH